MPKLQKLKQNIGKFSAATAGNKKKTFSTTLVFTKSTFNISSVHEVMLWFCKMSKLLGGVVLLFLFFVCY